MNFFTKNKIIAGVFGLVALVSVINTQAIIKLSSDVGGQNTFSKNTTEGSQSAQLLSSLGNCVSLLPASSNHTSFVDPADFSEDFDGLSKHMFVIGFKIKNTCSHTISIVQDSFSYPNGVNSYKVAKIEDFPNISNETLSSAYSFSGPVSSPITDIWGILGPDLIIPNTNLNGVMVTGNGEMKVTNILPNQEKEFVVSSYVDAGQSIHHSRLSLKNIRWFNTSNYSDSTLTSRELKIYSLTKQEAERYSTSYAKFKRQTDEDDECATGTIIGYDQNGNPIFCK